MKSERLFDSTSQGWLIIACSSAGNKENTLAAVPQCCLLICASVRCLMRATSVQTLFDSSSQGWLNAADLEGACAVAVSEVFVQLLIGRPLEVSYLHSPKCLLAMFFFNISTNSN